MAERKWEELSQAEKIEDLRRDVKILFEQINRTNIQFQHFATWDALRDLTGRVSQVEACPSIASDLHDPKKV